MQVFALRFAYPDLEAKKFCNAKIRQRPTLPF
jgi:hypothetical protein